MCVCVMGVRYPLAIQKVECLTRFLPTYTGETGVSRSSVTMRHTVPKGIDRMYRGGGGLKSEATVTGKIARGCVFRGCRVEA